MALIRCSECSHEVSDQAVACPQCGAPIKPPSPAAPAARSTSTGCLPLIGLLVLVVIGVAMCGKPTHHDAFDDIETTPPVASDDAAEPIRQAAVAHFRSADPLMTGHWVRPDEFWISVFDRSRDWQQAADGACNWIRNQGMSGHFSVTVVEGAALLNKRVESLASANCN